MNDVPDPLHFRAARDAYAESVETCLLSGSVTGSIIYGSVAIARTNRRSDFDAVLVCSDETAMQEARGVAEAASLASDGKVPINVTPYTRDMLASGAHEIDRYFGRHLTGGERIVQGEDPASYLQYAAVPPAIAFDEYIRNKKRRLGTAYFDTAASDAERLVGIQRMLEAPLAVGRNLAGVLDDIEGTHRATDRSANKDLMRHIAMRVFRELGVTEEAERLLTADRSYSEYVENTIAGEVSLPEYEAALRALHGQLPRALAWLNRVDRAFHARITD